MPKKTPGPQDVDQQDKITAAATATAAGRADAPEALPADRGIGGGSPGGGRPGEHYDVGAADPQRPR